MTPEASGLAAGMWIGIDPSLQSLLSRLEARSREPGFARQRETALVTYLQPYTSPEVSGFLSPLAEELALAELCLYADYLPDDGQPSLIEQVRDLVEVHVPQAEREWLDPLRHSWMDLVTVTDVRLVEGATELTVRSLGDRRAYRLAPAELAVPVRSGQALVTRLLTRGDRQHACGTAVRLAGATGQAVFAALDSTRQEMEVVGGAITLGEWGEFSKRYGHLLLWQVAYTRMTRLIEAEASIRYCRANGDPFLPSIALYDHDAFDSIAKVLADSGLWHAQEDRNGHEAESKAVRVWARRDDGSAPQKASLVANLILTPSQLWVECDTRDRLESIKHELAGSFGFTIHFCGEGWAGPPHAPIEPDLSEEAIEPRVLSLSQEEERRLWASLLEKLYLDWSDRPCPALNRETPRHAVASSSLRGKVSTLIDRMERDDPAARHTGRTAYDYERLRRHIGL